MLPYTLRQLVWMLRSALQLIYALSTGIVWVLQMVRLFAYGACVGICFIPHWWWYLTSPNIIRRVSYRSSDTTKKRNILRVLEAEGVDLHAVLRKSSTPPHLSLQSSGGRRRRVMPAPRSDSCYTGHDNTNNNTASGNSALTSRGGGGTPQRHGRPRRRPLSTAGTVAGSHSGWWDGEDVHGVGGGEVVEANRSVPRGHDVADGGSVASYPHAASAVAAGMRRRGSGGGYVGTMGALHLQAPTPDYTPHDKGEERSGALDAYTVPPPHAHSAIGPAPQQRHRSGPRRRGGGRATTNSDTPPSTALERLMDAAPVHLNPADGSALRSLPMQRTAAATTAAAREAGQSGAGAKTGGGRGGGGGGSRAPEATVRSVQRRPHPSLSPHRTSPALTHKAGVAEARQSSSSSCDMTGNRPENSSGEEGRGVGGVSHARDVEQPPLQSLPSAGTAAREERRSGSGGGAHASLYAGRTIYYDALPQPTLPNDPLLKDVLAALEENEFGGDDDDEHANNAHGGPVHVVPVEEEDEEDEAPQHPREQREHDEAHTSGQQQQQQQQVARGGRGGMRRPLRRGPPPPRPQHQPQQQPQQQQHARTFSEENILAGLEEEDEEDKMNLHNRATVDIVLPVPLDSLMKTLEYTQHSKRLRRKRFPIVINVTGAVWIIGSHLWSTMMARVLAQRGYVVFCPDYRNFPQTTMEGMTLDVSDAVAWVLNNAERYNGDLSNVTLIGQSAGAHLTMMSLLSQAQLSAYRSNTMHSTYEGVPPPSDVAYNVPRYNPREFIHRYVGLSGMYNVEGLVDHFQREGLNTPVLHQIAGGRDQLPRYSIHAYFDDRRGGDTGEVLPDNIFDYFPQRMFFVHGDADKCAPVTESASLVAMLRSAQDRYALRRRERNEEARRHALRSRRLLPGALAPQAAGVAATCNPTAAPYPHRAEAYAEEDVYGGGAHRNVHTPASAAWAQWGAGEEDGNDCCRGAEGDQDRERALYGGYEHLAAAAGGGGGRMSIGPPIFVSDTATRRSGGLGAATTSTAQQQQQHQQQQMYGPPTVVSPIVPPSRTDQPKSAVELEFIVIPNGRHSDAFVDECIAAGRSCCVDLLCDYESAVDCPSRSFSPSLARSVDDDSLCGSVTGAASHWGERVPTWMSQSSQVCAMPDGILPLAVPTEERSFPLRLCTLICPF